MKKTLVLEYYPENHSGSYNEIQIMNNHVYFNATDSTGNTYPVGTGKVLSEVDEPQYVVEFINQNKEQDQ